jgi:hypothetical protein
MRATVNIPEHVYAAVRSIADAGGVSVEEKLVELIRRGLDAGLRIDTRGVFPHFIVAEDAAPITLESAFAVD